MWFKHYLLTNNLERIKKSQHDYAGFLFDGIIIQKI